MLSRRLFVATNTRGIGRCASFHSSAVGGSPRSSSVGGLAHDVAHPVDQNVGQRRIGRVHLVQGNHRRHRGREQSLLIGDVGGDEVERRLGVGLRVSAGAQRYGVRSGGHVGVEDGGPSWEAASVPTRSADRRCRRPRARRWAQPGRWRAWRGRRGRARRSRGGWAPRAPRRSPRGPPAAPPPARRSSRCSSRCSTRSTRRSSRSC